MPVEYVLNGDYKGLYFVTQTIRIDKSRVNITEMADNEEDPINASDPTQASGGWIVEIDNYDTDPHITVMEHWNDKSGNPYPIWFTYDKSIDNASEVQLEYLTNSLSRINDLIFAEDKTDSSELESLLDFESLARFYLVQELMDNHESFHGSCYLFRERGENSKWKFGPVWDFGSAYQRGNTTNHFYDEEPYHDVWIEELAKFPVFQENVKAIWADFCENHYAGISDYLDSFVNQITSAAEADLNRWPEYGNDDLQGKKDEVIGYLKSRIKTIGGWMSGVVPVEPLEIYLRGYFNNWEITHRFNMEPDGTYKIHISELTSGFKVGSENWREIDYGAPRDMEPSLNKYELYALEKVGANISLTNDEPLTDVDVIFNPKEETLLVTDHSGVKSAENVAKAFSIKGNIITADESLAVTTIDGRTAARIAAGTSTMLAPGFYIVTSATATAKVAIR